MRYATDLTDTEWNLISYCFGSRGKMGRPRQHSCRKLLDAVLYLVKTGCQWRYLPEAFSPWGIVERTFGWLGR